MTRQRTQPGPPAYEETLRRLTLDDEAFLDSLIAERAGFRSADPDQRHSHPLDDHTGRLVRLGALIAIDAGPAALDVAVAAALGAGATVDEIVDVLPAVAPLVGSARVVAAAPHVAAAIGYDLSAAFEQLEPIGSASPKPPSGPPADRDRVHRTEG